MVSLLFISQPAFPKESTNVVTNNKSGMKTELLGKNKFKIIITETVTCTVTVMLNENRKKEYVANIINKESAKCFEQEQPKDEPHPGVFKNNNNKELNI